MASLDDHRIFSGFSVFNAFLTGVLVLLLFPYDWSWPVSMAFGTIISATDPVAVVATLKELGLCTNVHVVPIVLL